ncbi:MAG: PTS sugar transporter subunit IIA [Lactobacillales bacterium]|jgi:PTS system nitrogen regulatory IIA component|nr:PTS sugar transporter subunit IIA [Lactobacillales bacterium]
MKIKDILPKDEIILNDSISNKKQLLELLAKSAAAKTKLDERTILEALVERERLGTTGVGRGVALPHTRLTGLKKIFCAFFRINPIDFEAVDGKLVDLVFLLLVPEEAGADHLKALARLSRLLRNETVAADLRKATKAAEIYKIIEENDKDDI